MVRDASLQSPMLLRTDPRQRGFPPPAEVADVGTPREQWELDFRSFDRESWAEYRRERAQFLGS